MKSQFEVRAHRIVILVFLAASLVASYWLIAPFVEPIILAILIGLLAHPAHQRLTSALGGRKTAASLLSCLILTLIVMIPLMVLLVAVLKQGINYSVFVKDWATQEHIQQLTLQPWVVEVQSRLTRILPEGALQADNIRDKALAVAGMMGGHFADMSTKVLGSVTRSVFNIVLLLFVLFFVLRDHDKLIASIHRALPLATSEEDTLFAEVKSVSKSALFGSLATAATQGVVGGFGLWLAGFPGVFWGAVMAFTSLIPFVGTALVWVPAALYLVVTGEMGWALFLAVWGIAVVGSIDNFLRPMLMQGASMNTVVVFFSLIGGLQVFGLMGLIYGPLIFAITLVMFRLYEKEFSEFLDSQDHS